MVPYPRDQSCTIVVPESCACMIGVHYLYERVALVRVSIRRTTAPSRPVSVKRVLHTHPVLPLWRHYSHDGSGAATRAHVGCLSPGRVQKGALNTSESIWV